MLKKRNLLFLSLLILGVLLLTSCFLNPPVTDGILKGQVIVPEGAKQTKELTGQALPDATVNIIDPATGAIIATTTIDATGAYQVFVPAGGPYLLQAVKDGVKVLQFTPQVEVGIEYELGTADCSTTAVALIAQAMLDVEDYPDDPANINLTDIETDSNFNDVMNPVCSIIQAGGDPTVSAAIEQAVADFLSPPTPAPVPTYSVTYDGNGNTGGSVPTDSKVYKENITVTALGRGSLVKTGYAFDNWNTKPDGTGTEQEAGSTFVIGASNVTFYAQWTVKAYNVTFDSQEGSSITSYMVKWNCLASEPNSPIRTAYTFSGWYKESGCINPWVFATDTVISNVTLYAKWTANNYTITFDKNDAGASGTMPAQTITYGSSAKLTACTFTKTGWTFAGWATTSGGDVVYADGASYIMGTADVTLYAKWTINSYTVTYDGNGSTGGITPTDSSLYDYGATVTVLGNTGNLVKTQDLISFLFTGWNTAANGSGTGYIESNTFDMGDANVILYAQWSALRCTGPAGGLIFYDKGFVSDGWRYLEAAPQSTEWTHKQWGSDDNLITGTGMDIGTGQGNTTTIVTWLNSNSETDRAAQLCDALEVNGYSDWFLPSRYELDKMYENLYHQTSPVGGFVANNYWSSSEYHAMSAWGQFFSSGEDYYGPKYNIFQVRAVRAF